MNSAVSILMSRCKFCPQKYDSNSRLIIHIERHINNGSIRKCRFCEFYSAVTQVLREHEYKHTKEKPYQCEVCSFRCRCKGDLIKHQQTHSSYKRYSATAAGQQYFTTTPITSWQSVLSLEIYAVLGCCSLEILYCSQLLFVCFFMKSTVQNCL